MTRTMDFPSLKPCKDPDKANYQNYLAWQAQTAARRREAQTQFNLYQTRKLERMSNQAQFKDDIERQIAANRDVVERRLSMACTCENCTPEISSRRNSLSSEPPLSPTSSARRNSIGSFSSVSSQGGSPPGLGLRGPSSRNSLVVNPPPRSRHHKRKCNSVSA